MTATPEVQATPRVFAEAVEAARRALESAGRPGVLELHEVPAPRRLAPHGFACSAEVLRDGLEVGSGRFVVLHDPEGQDGWQGDTRVVAFVSADVEPEMAADPALVEVGWSWLTEALDQRSARHQAAGGTVTRTASLSFGLTDDAEPDNEIEVRASWSPSRTSEGLDLTSHLQAWTDLLCACAGIPPPGVTALRRLH